MTIPERTWRWLDRITTCAMLAASLSVLWIMGFSSGRGSAAVAGPAAPVEDIQGVVNSEIVRTAAIRGDPKAKIALIEFSDYQCPYCGRSVSDVQPQLLREYVGTNKIRHLFLNFPLEGLHTSAFKAAEAAECAGDQGKYWEMHDQLFANQKALLPQDLRRYAETLRLDATRFSGCLNGANADKVRSHMAVGRQFDISGTPAFLIGDILSDGSIRVHRKVSGAVPYAVFKTALGG
jgi:protein-disulfide isomerase